MSTYERVTFDGTHGTLAGAIDLPGKPPEAYALFAHCFTGGKDYPATRRICRELTKRGLAVLRFDFAGVGESGGEFAESTYSSNVADVRHAAQYLRDHHDAPTLLVGHSLGGAAVLAAAPDLPEVSAVATIGAPGEPAHVAHLFAHALDDIAAHGEAEVILGGRAFRIRADFIDDLREQEQDAKIARLGRPLLIIHAPGDDIVGISNAEHIYRAAQHPKSFVALDGADHLLTDRRQAQRSPS